MEIGALWAKKQKFIEKVGSQRENKDIILFCFVLVSLV